MSQRLHALHRLLPRFRIAHLFLLTFGIAVGLGIWRLSRTATAQQNEPPTLFSFADLIAVLAPLSVWVSMALLLGAWVRWRARGAPAATDSPSTLPQGLAIAWRLLCAGLLAAFLFVAVDLYAIRMRSHGDLAVYELREKSLGLSCLILLVGMLLSYTAIWVRPSERRFTRRAAWLRRPGWVRGLNRLSLTALVLVLLTNEMLIPYLALIATLGISFAYGAHGLPMERLDVTIRERAAESVAPALVTCGAVLCSIAWALHVNRRCRRSSLRPSAGAWIVHAVSMATVLGCAAHLVLVTVAKISHFIAVGFAELLDPLDTAILFVGFAGLAAGLGAQVAFGSPAVSGRDAAVPKPHRSIAVHLWWLLRLVIGTALVSVIGLMYFGPDAPILSDLAIVGFLAELPSHPLAYEIIVLMWNQPLAWVLVAAAVAVKQVVLYGRQRMSGGPEHSSEQLPPSVALALFALWWPLITTLMIVCVPLLGVLGFLILHGIIELGW